MRKNICALFLCMCISILGSAIPETEAKAERAIDVARRHGHNLEERYQPAGSIISEIQTGQILWQENAQVTWAPASMTKLMTILVAYDAMAEGKFQLNTSVNVTDKCLDIAGRYSLSNNKMKAGASYTVSELIDLIIVPSSAAATYMLSDLVEPDIDKFVVLMNQKAAALGMSQTVYYNTVGIPNRLLVPYQPNQPLENNNITSPTDYALLCSYFVKTYPDILNHTKAPQIVVKPGTPYEEQFTSYQISLEGAKYGLPGVDGLKTGSSGEAGFNYSATAKREETRLVEVVMGVSRWEDQTGEEVRHLIGNAILEEAFAKYEYRMLLPKGVHKIEGKELVLKEDFWDCVPKNQEISYVISDGKLKVNMERSYLPGYEAPAAEYHLASEKAVKASGNKSSSPGKGMSKAGSFFRKPVIAVIIGAVIILLMLIAGRVFYVRHRMKQLRKRRRIKRQQLKKHNMHDK